MVRLINQKNIPVIANITYQILKYQSKVTNILNWQLPKLEQCIYVMWHEHQFCVHGFPRRDNVNVLISTSLDGDIVALVCQKWGFKVIRGSAGHKRAVASTLELKDRLKNGESLAIMVDGPRGPYHSVKRGAPALAKDSGIPIVPVYWYSTDRTLVKLPSWDKISVPMGPCKILNLYGEPIYTEGKTEEEISQAIKDSLQNLEEIAPKVYKSAKEERLWNKKQ